MSHQTPPSDTVSAPVSRRRWWAFLLTLLVAAVSAFAVWRLVFAAPKNSENVITLSGRIEGDNSVIAPKVSGRIVEVRFREGDSIKAGELIALLDDEQVRAREDQARAALAASEARERAARSQLSTLHEQLRQSAIQTGQSRM